MHDYTITFATLNCLDYTRTCLDSLWQAGVPEERVVVVDNASRDGTVDYLRASGLPHVVFNRENLSCGAAWNQGILARQSEWTIVMNNDLVVTEGFAQGLIDFALRRGLLMASPAMVEGELDYDFKGFAREASRKMGQASRLGSSHAVCMCIHWSAFMRAGFFRAEPRLLGFEDAVFFNALRAQGVAHGTTGSVWLHHFGSVTQEHMKLARGIASSDVLVKVNDRKVLNQSWLERKLLRHRLKREQRTWREQELLAHGMTLHGLRRGQQFEWI